MKFEIGSYQKQKVIFIEGELFDWGLDDDALNQANEFSSNPNALKAIHSDVREYFLECLKEYLGFKPTMGQINKAIKIGHISRDD